MAHFHDNALVGASGQGGYQISRSLRFNSADSAYLNRAAGTSTSQSIFTYSGWVKLCRAVEATINYGELLNGYAAGNDTGYGAIFFYNGKLRVAGWSTTWRETTQIFRDPSAWYHIVVAVDTTQATAANRVKVYINGIEVTSFSLSNNPTQNATVGLNNNSTALRIGVDNPASSSRTFDGYLTEINFIDGQALTPSSFGETDTITGVWKPKKYTGTYGTNGFYLNFSDNSGTTSTTLGKDSSGNSNNWTPNNFSVTAGAGNDSMIDTPTPYADGGNGRGNYCTMNPLDKNPNITPTNGNLDIVGTGATHRAIKATHGISSGKWYWENTVTSYSSGFFGLAKADSSLIADGQYVGANATSWGYLGNGNKYTNGSASAYGASFTTGDVIAVAFDADNGTLTFYKNNTSQGTAYSGLTSGPYVPACSTYSASDSYSLNFGQRAFAYTPPSGFVALNTQNLPDPSIKKPSSYMDVLTWSGTGGGSGATRSLTGLGFSPDLVWGKIRTSSSPGHILMDAVRGVGTGKYLQSNTTNAEGTSGPNESLYGYLSSLDSAGFTVTNGTSTFDNWNKSGDTYVAWCWDESATPGIDIITDTTPASYADKNYSHNLGVTPSFIIYKERTGTANWWVWHQSISPASNAINLNTTGSTQSGAYWGTHTSSVIAAKAGIQTSLSVGVVIYAWSEVAGFSKFGSYTGNGSTDGPFVFCGFRPRWILMKSSTNAATPWQIFDAVREPENTVEQTLIANGPNTEPYDTASPVDFLSNGFKLRGGASSYNNYNTGTWIFCAWAEAPFKYALAR